MKRWFYILLGGLGMSLVVGAIVAMIWVTPLSSLNAVRALVCEVLMLVVGSVLSVVGFIYGRNAGELDISKYMKTPRRDHGVDGAEIRFACPVCHKGYRGSPLLAGKSFTCRDCRQVFEVSTSNQLPGTTERRLLPAPGLRF